LFVYLPPGCVNVELLIKREKSGASKISIPDEDSAERSTENNSKRNRYHACHTGPRILAVVIEELLKAISMKPASTKDIEHPKPEGTDESSVFALPTYSRTSSGKCQYALAQDSCYSSRCHKPAAPTHRVPIVPHSIGHEHNTVLVQRPLLGCPNHLRCFTAGEVCLA
jgi:hypothetical protein